MTWTAFERYDWTHVVPDDDLREHELTKDCWCHPYDDDLIWVHNSMDRREDYEHGKRALS